MNSVVPPDWMITKKLRMQLLGFAQKVYPNEFIAMLGVSKADPFLLSEFIVLPAEFGRTHSQLRTDLIPFDPLIVGSVHSHPSPSTRPSSQDLIAFSKLGKIHLILGYPYTVERVSAYSHQGQKIFLRDVA